MRNEHISEPIRDILRGFSGAVPEVQAELARERADLDRLRAVWRAVAEEMRLARIDLAEAVVNAALATGLAEIDPLSEDIHLTSAGARLARGGA